jgi:hypothetical protein
VGGVLARLYAFKFFDYFVLIGPLYAVMFVDAGLSPSEIAIALAAWSVTTFVLEVPAGVIADRVSRRHVLALAQTGRAIGLGVWLVWPQFWGFFIGLVLWGAKSAFTSGTFEALLFDELAARGREVEYTRTIGRARAVQAFGALCAALGAAAIAKLGYGVTLMASIAASAPAALAMLALPPAQRALRTHGEGFVAQLRRGVGLALGDRLVLSLVAFGALTMAFGGSLSEFWPVFGVKVGLARPLVAVFVGGQFAMEMLASALAHRVQRLPSQVYYLAFGVAGAVLLAAAHAFTPPAMLLLILYSAALKAVDVVFEGRLQQAIGSHQRATIGSVKGFAAQIAIGSFYLGFGYAAQWSSYRAAFMACGGAGIVIGLTWLAWSMTSARRPIRV